MASPADDMIAALDAFRPDPADPGTELALVYMTEGFDQLSEADKTRIVPHMFRVMERGWDADVGNPGPMVHAIETLGIPAYVEQLTESVRRRPMYLNLWMVNRILNVTENGSERTALMTLLRGVCEDPKWADVSDVAAGFLKHQGDAAAD
jgi:hypothetical protein